MGDGLAFNPQYFGQGVVPQSGESEGTGAGFPPRGGSGVRYRGGCGGSVFYSCNSEREKKSHPHPPNNNNNNGFSSRARGGQGQRGGEVKL